MLLRFYYFTFLYHYTHQASTKNDEGKWFRALGVVLLTFFFLVMWIYVILEHFFNVPMKGLYQNRYYVIIGFGVPVGYLLYLILAQNGKYNAIYEEFESNPWNTKKNRVICWVIWVASIFVDL